MPNRAQEPGAASLGSMVIGAARNVALAARDNNVKKDGEAERVGKVCFEESIKERRKESARFFS